MHRLRQLLWYFGSCPRYVGRAVVLSLVNNRFQAHSEGPLVTETGLSPVVE